MPVEIRELVIQAQVGSSQSDVSSTSDIIREKTTVDLDQLQQSINQTINDSIEDLKVELIRDFKIWIKEYLEKERRGY